MKYGISLSTKDDQLVMISNPRKGDFTEERLEGISSGMHWKHIKKLVLKLVVIKPDEKLQIKYLKTRNIHMKR